MPRYIDIDKYDKFFDISDCVMKCEKEISCMECFYENFGGAEDVAPIVHAKWLEKDGGEKYMDTGICSNCGRLRIRDNYCGNCGAKMGVEEWQHEED